MPDIEALYREHRARLVRLVERELHDHNDAEDVVQTAFLDAQRALKRGTIPRNPRAWLAAIALNAARELRRRRGRVEALEQYAVQEASCLPEIKAALRGLPKNEQAAVVYRDLLGLSYAETAAQMGATVPAVTMLLHRARSRLRKVLGIAPPGVGPWKWLRGSPGHVAAAKAAGAVVLAGGLATAGVVTAQRVGRAAEPAMAGITTATQQPPRNDGATAMKFRFSHGRPPGGRRSGARAVLHNQISPTVGGQTAPGAAPGLTAPPMARSAVPGLAGVSMPAVSLPTLSVPASTLPTPTLPGTNATIETPVLTTTAGVPGTTVTVPTPVATVTVSIP